MFPGRWAAELIYFLSNCKNEIKMQEDDAHELVYLRRLQRESQANEALFGEELAMVKREHDQLKLRMEAKNAEVVVLQGKNDDLILHMQAKSAEVAALQVATQQLPASDRYVQIGMLLTQMETMKQCPVSVLGQRLYTTAMGLLPKGSVEGFAQVIPIAVTGFLADLGLQDHLDLSLTPNVCPSPTRLQTNLKLARDVAYMNFAQLVRRGIPTSAIHDKCNKNGAEHLIVQEANWNLEKDCVECKTLSADECNDSSDSGVAASIDHTCNRVEDAAFNENVEDGENDPVHVQFHGQSTDDGGGGVTESVFEKLRELDRVGPITYIANCTLHAHNRPFQVAFEESLGKGGLTINSLVQFFHTCWSIQEALGENFLPAWKEFVGEGAADDITDDMVRLIKPLLTRWSYVVKCATAILERWNDWKAFMDKVYKCFTTTEEGMARKCVGVMKDPKLKCELEFVVAFGQEFYMKHFVWLQRIDDVSKLDGFFSHEMSAHLAVMEQELQNMKDNWRTLDIFSSCIELLDTLPPDEKDTHNEIIRHGKESTETQFTIFFDKYTHVFNANFKRWKKKLVVFSIASTNCEVATTLAKWYLQKGRITSSSDETNIFEGSSVHPDCNLTMKTFVTFLKSCEFHNDAILDRNLSAVREIASGSSLYNGQGLSIAELLLDVKLYYLSIATVTQMCERTVQETALCSASRKGESDISSLVIFRSTDLLPVMAEFRHSMKIKSKRGNQHMGPGLNGEREIRSARARNNADRRERTGQKIRERARPTKNKIKAHITHAILTCPTQAEMKHIQGVKRRRETTPEGESLISKRFRLERFLSKIRTANQLSRKDPSNVRVIPVDVPASFRGTVSICKFSKELLLPYCHREIFTWGPYKLPDKIGKAKLILGKLIRAERDNPPDNLEQMNWNQVKNSLEGTPEGVTIRLADEYNKSHIQDIYTLSMRGAVAL